MNDNTTELPTYTRPVGGTDPHPAKPEKLLEALDAQLDTVWAAMERRGTLAGAEALQKATSELVALSQSLDGYAATRAEMLTGTAEVALSHEADPDPYDTAMSGLDEAPKRRVRSLVARLFGGGR
ncbi:hypothetical protein GCM10027447_12810 [Glycomyces halotolerans]